MLAEVEKIWILYDADNNGKLDFEEVESYLKEMAFPHLKLTDREVREIFDEIDDDGNGSIDKKEMFQFVCKIM